ncbi:MAG TPA: PilZ domain-containing protein [Gemmataceae bacterium]|nr:PilZ domain-containing protein [Gemmataceae bacterium]
MRSVGAASGLWRRPSGRNIVGPFGSRPITGNRLHRTRAAYRRPGNPVAVRLTNAFDQLCLGLVLDRSSAGVRLAVDGPLDIGRTFLVLPDLAPAGTGPVEVEVRWCEEQSDHYQVGCRFTSPLPVTVLLLFG